MVIQKENPLSQCAFSIGLLLHPLPERMSVVSVHIDLTEEVKSCIVTFRKLFNLSFGARLLQRDSTVDICFHNTSHNCCEVSVLACVRNNQIH